MRILVLQLARFGDIYQTWPVLKAFQRQGVEVHVLVRERFKAATLGLEGVTVHTLPTANVLAPVLGAGDEAAALARLTAWVDPLIAQKFDRVINLSFSPASSYLTDLLSEHGAEVRGYTRHTDGYFSIPDDSSAYFYAQVGIGRANRYHLTDVFAAVAEVTLETEDRIFKKFEKRERIVVHLGASQIEKAYPAELWIRALKALAGRTTAEIVLVGSADERALADEVAHQACMLEIKNLCGQTTLPQMFELIGQARLLIGADSAPMHIAALVDTPALNLSSAAVNFYETGPVSAGSRVLYQESISAIDPESVAREALAMWNRQTPSGPCFERTSDGFTAHQLSAPKQFAWDLLQALYTGTPYPPSPNQAASIAFQRLFELAELALMQLAQWDSSGTEPTHAAQVLHSIDQLLEEIPRLNGDVVPVVQWFQTQRLRLKPSTPAETLTSTRKLFEELLWVAAVYHRSEGDPARAIELCTRLSPALREYEFQAVESDFQALVAALQELAQHSTNVGDRPWSSVLRGMNEAITRRDYIELADQLEFELKPQLQFTSTDVII